MPYTHDVFLSYRRKRQYVDWIDDFFLERFRDKLSENLPSEWGEVQVFVDRKSIEAGEEWRQEIESALAGARCMVALWAADYFGSPWCYSEWKSFHQKRPIIPIQWSIDNRFFPDDAKSVQAANFAPFTLTGEGFRKTEEFAKYQQAIAAFALRVRDVLIGAPPDPPPGFAFSLLEPPRRAGSNRLVSLSAPATQPRI
jgi:hypothetical protein